MYVYIRNHKYTFTYVYIRNHKYTYIHTCTYVITNTDTYIRVHTKMLAGSSVTHHQIYGHIRCMYTILALNVYLCAYACCVCACECVCVHHGCV